MKKLLSKVVSSSLFGLFLSSYSKDSDNGDGKVFVTGKYRIIVNPGMYLNWSFDSHPLCALQ